MATSTDGGSSVVIPPDLKDVLPTNYKYKVEKFTSIEAYSEEPRFTAEFRTTINSKVEALKWLSEFTDISLSTWRVRNNYPEDTDRIVYKIRYRCHNNTLPHLRQVAKPHEKHVGCPAKLHITIQKPLKHSKILDSVKSFPCLITLANIHNHITQSAESLCHRDPSNEVREKFIKLFSCHSPMSALEVHLRDLQLEHGDNYFSVVHDRFICPDATWVYRLYYNTFQESYGKGQGSEMLAKLDTFITEFNTACGVQCAKMESKPDEYFTVAICSPLMRRVHENVPTAGELVCVDASGNMDRFQCRVFLLMVHTCVGGLPLGVLITSSESEQVLSTAFRLLKSILPEKCFYGKGVTGPTVFITNDCASERKSLQLSFPNSTALLCTFHVLQAAWRYVWDCKTGADKHETIELFSYVKELMYSQTQEDLEEKFRKRVESEIVKSHVRFSKYYKDLYKKKEEWAIFYRNELLIRGHNTNNLIEAAMRILKDKILLRTKAYNVVQLFSFVSQELQQYYERKILCVISGRPDQVLKLEYIALGDKAQKLDVESTDCTNIFSVHNSKNGQTYIVDLDASNCTCPVGLNGGACKHQFAAFKHLHIDTMQFLPKSGSEKLHFHFIATGKKNVPPNWYNTLQCGVSSDNCQSESITNEFPLHVPEQMHTAEVSHEEDENGGISSGKIDEIRGKLNDITTDLMTKFESQPEYFYCAISKFAHSYWSCQTDAAKVSALTTFGHYAGGGQVAGSGRKGRAINVQSTAIARRARKLGGRKCLISGRPPRACYVTEHGYYRKKIHSLLRPKRRGLPALHSLTHCVSELVSLSKTHSAK